LCAVLGEQGKMLQIVHEFFDPGLTVSRVEMLGQLSRQYGIPTTLSPLFHSEAMPASVSQVMDAVAGEWATGARVWPQVQTRPIDISFTLVSGLEMLGAMPGSTLNAASFVVRQVALERNRDLVGRTLGEIANERKTSPAELLIDLAVEEDLGTWFMRADIGHRDPTAVGDLLSHPYVHVGASDGGAHVGSFATYGDTGLLLGRFVRDTKSMRLEAAIKKITSDPAVIWGLRDRGQLTKGYAADVAVFDAASIDRGPEVASNDFPGDGLRWIRRQVGMDTVIVNGQVTWSAKDGYTPGARAGVIAS
jgi:N-acyl-D-amino-acid deacylase